MTMKPPELKSKPPRHGVARVMSKLGMGSRTQAARWVREGRVRVNGRVTRDAELPVRQGIDEIVFDEKAAVAAMRLVIMLNKPRGLVTTASDERDRDTVYRCLEGSGLPWVAPIGRLDKASEGLLLFTNDPAWAARISDPAGPDKKYHVQIGRWVDASLLMGLEKGVHSDGEHLSVKSVRSLRTGKKHMWLEIVLDEGRNRQIRRLLAAVDVPVLRLVRVAVGSLTLGDLPKAGWRALAAAEIEALGSN